MNDEQLYKDSFEELSIVLSDAMKNNAMLKAQAEYYIAQAKALFEENTQLKSEIEELKKQSDKPDISDTNKTEENK